MTKKAKRIIIACNTSHIVIAKAYLAMKSATFDNIETILLLADYNHAADATYRQMDKLAKASPEFSVIHWVNDFMTPVKLKTDAVSIGAYINTIQNTIADGMPNDVVEYCTWSIFNRYEQLIAEAFPTADIVLYEDGIALYIDRGTSPACPTNESRQTWILNSIGISPEHIRRIVSIPHMLGKGRILPNYLNQSLLFFVDKNSYINAAQDAIKCFGIDIKQLNNSGLANVLVLGTPMSDILDNYAWDDELLLYKRVIQKLIYDENCIVYWKEHPFIRRPFASTLRDTINSDRFLIINTPQSAPVEYTALLVDFSKTISIGSSAQCMMYELFDIPYAVIQQTGMEIINEAGDSLATLRRESTPYYI